MRWVFFITMGISALSLADTDFCPKIMALINVPQKSYGQRSLAAMGRLFARSPQWKLDPALAAKVAAIEADSTRSPLEKATAINREVTDAFVASRPARQRIQLEAMLAQTRKNIVHGDRARQQKKYATNFEHLVQVQEQAGKVTYPSPMYNAATREIVGMHDLSPNDPRTELVLLHELVHAFDDMSFPSLTMRAVVPLALHHLTMFRWPFLSTSKYLEETDALGSQWEQAQRFSPELRKKMIDFYAQRVALEPNLNDPALLRETAIEIILKEDKVSQQSFGLARHHIEGSPGGEKEIARVMAQLEVDFNRISDFEATINRIFVATMTYASLPKNEFIQKVRAAHGSTMAGERGYDRTAKPLRFPLLILSSYQIGMLIAAVSMDNDEETDDRLKKIALADVQLLARTYAWLASQDESETK